MSEINKLTVNGKVYDLADGAARADLCVGFNGASYATPGEAVRRQFESLINGYSSFTSKDFEQGTCHVGYGFRNDDRRIRLKKAIWVKSGTLVSFENPDDMYWECNIYTEPDCINVITGSGWVKDATYKAPKDGYLHILLAHESDINQNVPIVPADFTGEIRLLVDVNISELKDIRTGFDGTTYANAGEAVRGQVGQLNDELAAYVVTEDAIGDAIAIRDGAGKKLQVMNVYGKTTQDGTPTPEAPVEMVSAGDSGTIDFRITGKNMLSLPYASRNGHTSDGITYTVNADGSVYAEGTSTDWSYFALATKKDIDLGESRITESTLETIYKFSPSVRYEGGNIYIALPGNTVTNKTFYPQLEIGTVATDWESPKALQTCSIGGVVLRGIPVSSGGNYTDSSGQQWITDEIDLERKVYIQRLELTPVVGKSWWWDSQAVSNGYRLRGNPGARYNLTVNAVLCDKLPKVSTWYNEGVSVGENKLYVNLQKFGSPPVLEDWYAYLDENPIQVLLALAAPIETPLSADVVAALEGLHTNKPNTTIFSNSGVGVKVSYTADTKTYIDNKFNELAAALVNNT